MRLILVGLVALVLVAPATAARPCWKVAVADWFADGRFDGSYSCSCYRDVFRHLPVTGESWGIRDAVADAARRACNPPRAHPRAN